MRSGRLGRKPPGTVIASNKSSTGNGGRQLESSNQNHRLRLNQATMPMATAIITPHTMG